MTDTGLYSYEEVCSLIEEKGLKKFDRKNADINSIWQFGEKRSCLQVRTAVSDRYVMYATESDFNAIKRKADQEGLALVLTERTSELLEAVISEYEKVSSKAILFIRNGNRIMQPSPVEMSIPHKIVFFTNENLEYVLDILKENDNNKSKAKNQKVVYHFVAPKKEKEPEIEAEKIGEIFPLESRVSHDKYGEGTVTSITDGRITVDFDDFEEKIFSATICITKKLLKKAE
ncbi:MAG: hypothetical protein K6A61_12280 [Butyrivibrio sp.]|nr:hypothetical protein [Butyrivibrio sp.]